MYLYLKVSAWVPQSFTPLPMLRGSPDLKQTSCPVFVFDCGVVRLKFAAVKQFSSLVFIASLQSPKVLCDPRAPQRTCFITSFGSADLGPVKSALIDTFSGPACIRAFRVFHKGSADIWHSAGPS